jgi:hypothetical protein
MMSGEYAETWSGNHLQVKRHCTDQAGWIRLVIQAVDFLHTLTVPNVHLSRYIKRPAFLSHL